MGPEMALVAAMAGGITMSAAGQYQQGKEQRKLAKAQAAAMAQDAAAVKEESRERARKERKEGRKLLARQTVTYAASGVKPGEGTPLLVMLEDAMEVEESARNIQLHGARASSRLLQESKWRKRAGRSAYRAGVIGAGSTLLTGGAQIGLHGYRRGWF